MYTKSHLVVVARNLPKNIDISWHSLWQQPPSWIFVIGPSEFVTFQRYGCLFLERRTRFGSNTSYNCWERPASVSGVPLIASCELTSGSVFWSLGHLCVVALHLCAKFCASMFIPFGDISILRNSIWPPSAMLNLLRGESRDHPRKPIHGGYSLQKKFVIIGIAMLRYKYLKFLSFTLESRIHGSVYGGLSSKI